VKEKQASLFRGSRELKKGHESDGNEASERLYKLHKERSLGKEGFSDSESNFKPTVNPRSSRLIA